MVKYVMGMGVQKRGTKVMGIVDSPQPHIIVHAPKPRSDSEPEHIGDTDQFNLSTDCPLLCVDGLLFACEYDGDSCTPIFGIRISDFVAVVRHDICKSDAKFKSPSPNRKSRSNTVNSSPSLSPSLRRRANSMLHRDPHTSHLHTESEDFLGISYESLEQPSRSSFLVPILQGDTPEKTPDLTRKGTEQPKLYTENSERLSVPKSNGLSIGATQDSSEESRKQEYELLIRWVESTCHDYVTAERIKSCGDLAFLLEALLTSSTAVLVSIKVQSPEDIIVTYQFMQKFKQDYMLVRIDRNYCMLMKTF